MSEHLHARLFSQRSGLEDFNLTLIAPHLSGVTEELNLYGGWRRMSTSGSRFYNFKRNIAIGFPERWCRTADLKAVRPQDKERTLSLRRKYAIWSIASIVAIVVGGEVFARLYLGLGTPPLSISHPAIEYMFKPNQDVCL